MKQQISKLCLMMAMFFLPFGYDALFALIMKATGSYWIADLIFYGIAGLFFLAHFILDGLFSKMFSFIRRK
jgi:hypothetical protein